jgi:hypothetical protein
MSASDQSVVLLRIAVALERIADALAKQPQPEPQGERTPFPWELMTIRTRKYVSRHVVGEIADKNPRYAGMEWPLCCEDIRKLGMDELLEARNFGMLGWNEVVAQLNKMGK